MLANTLSLGLGIAGGFASHGIIKLVPFVGRAVKAAFSTEHKVAAILAKADRLGLKLVTDVKAQAVNAAAEVKSIP